MTSSAAAAADRKLIIGVDTHKHVHVAVAVDQLGARIADRTVPVDAGGYRGLLQWARDLGRIEAFGIEGTGSYGVGLASFLRRQGVAVVEVNRGDRRSRRANGKSDTLDAEAAARAVLAGTATAVPKSADGAAEMIRQIKVARDTACKARTAAIVTLKTIVINAPPELREQLDRLSDKKLIDRCAGFRPGSMVDPTAAAKHTLRALARRWVDLDTEVRAHDRILQPLTVQASPTLCEGFGIGTDTAAEMLIVFGDNPDRIRSEAAFAKLCGACPVPASSGSTNRHRLSRAGHRQANAALYRAVIVRMRFHQPTIDYVARRTAQGLSKRDIIRCLKRFLAREIYQRVMTDHRARHAATPALNPTLDL
jgi:transposase